MCQSCLFFIKRNIIIPIIMCVFIIIFDGDFWDMHSIPDCGLIVKSVFCVEISSKDVFCDYS